MTRPVNCFILFCKANRKRTQLEYPDLSNSEISSILGAQWREMDESQKVSYKALAEEKRRVSLGYIIFIPCINLNIEFRCLFSQKDPILLKKQSHGIKDILLLFVW